MSEQGRTAAGPVVRIPVAVLAVLAAVVVALLAVALVVRLDAEQLPSAPALDPPPAAPEATTSTPDPARTARFQEFSITLAGAPYGCGDPQDPPRGFPAYEGCSRVVHANDDATGHDWSALTGVLLVGDGPVTRGDLPATTTAVLDALVPQLYSADDHYSLGTVSDDDAQLGVPTGRSATRLANVDVRRKGLATPYDRLTVVVVQLESGRCVAFFSDVPHDASKAALQAVTTSRNSISVRG